jgi:hypothetical protein
MPMKMMKTKRKNRSTITCITDPVRTQNNVDENNCSNHQRTVGNKDEVTTKVTIPGRYLVFLPFESKVNIKTN